MFQFYTKKLTYIEATCSNIAERKCVLLPSEYKIVNSATLSLKLSDNNTIVYYFA